MLVISRKIGEALLIGDNIRITVSGCSGDKISLGIEAPKEISILRCELVETIKTNLEGSEKISDDSYKDIAALLKICPGSGETRLKK